MKTTAMEPCKSNAAITLCVQDVRIRYRLAAIIARMGINYIIWSSEDLLNFKFQDYIMLLETGNNVEKLYSLVDHIYAEWDKNVNPQIIAFVSEAMLEENPRLGGWIINHHAAVACVVVLRKNTIYPDTEMELISLIDRLLSLNYT